MGFDIDQDDTLTACQITIIEIKNLVTAMYKNILVPVVFDHEPPAKDALAVANALLDKGGKITLFHVVEEIPSHVVAQLPKGMLKKSMDETVAALKEIADDSKLKVEPVVKVGHASRTILEQADESGAECIVISSHNPGLSDYFLGSTASRVVRHAKCAVHVLR